MAATLPLLLLLPMLLRSVLSFAAAAAGTDDHLHPVILIPGSGGNRLEAKLTTNYNPTNIICKLAALSPRYRQWFPLWFDPAVIIPPLTRCFADQMKLTYDASIDDYHNAPGVQTRVPDFGSARSLLYLNSHFKHITEYMAPLISALQEELGYIDGQNLFGAPYDFRYGPTSSVGSQYLRDLRQLIETAASSNGGKPVILLTHSLGGLFALHLLNNSSTSWRRHYIKHLVTLSTPWGGTVQEMLTFASGYTLGIPVVDPLIVREEQRSAETNLWLLPSHRVFGEKPLVFASNSRSYSARDIPEFLKDIGYEEGIYPYEKRIMALMDRKVEVEGVQVTCVVGSGVDTPETLFYMKRRGFDEQPEVVFGDGDGTVNAVSLMALEKELLEAGREERSVVKVIKLQGITHSAILKNRTAINVIMEELVEINLNHSTLLYNNI